MTPDAAFEEAVHRGGRFDNAEYIGGDRRDLSAHSDTVEVLAFRLKEGAGA